MAKILLVEDDGTLATRVLEWLESERHVVEHAQSGTLACERLEDFQYEIIILDLGLPDMSGIDVLKKFRARGGITPVLILTGQDGVEDKERGLDSGADDYLTKPFDARELSARLRALQRRPQNFSGVTLTAGLLVLDTVSRKVKLNDVEIALKPREFAMLEYMMRRPGKVVSPDELLRNVWGSDSDSTSETIYTHIKNLRKKLTMEGVDPPIKTVHGVGYRVDL
ncbi:MAG: response regulator transcription factor [Candidatus Melainabacteria bacterium]|jgi:DNA-binding response OmpR family regulator|nr:response regulator transcription factor [Candidatus Melainabacteria bacterium]